MQKIKNAIKGHRHGKDDEYDNTAGATTYGHHGTTAYGDNTMGTTGMGTSGYAEGQIVDERPVAVGVAEVPVVVTEQERVVTEGHRHTEHHREHHHMAEEVCGQKTFTEVEDRPVVRERVERIVEHRPVEKQYVVETRFVGEKEMGVAGAEIVDIKDRVVDVAAPGPTCPVNTGAVMNEVVAGHTSGMTGTTGTHHTHHTGAHTHSSDRLI